MRVFKFGGASVKDVEGLENVANVLRKTGAEELVIVVSAMGKTTNALEDVVSTYIEGGIPYDVPLEKVKAYHYRILHELKLEKNRLLQSKINSLFSEIDLFLSDNTSFDRDFVYDQVVPYGELLSSTILHAVLEQEGFSIEWLDARKVLITDASFREANINWSKTKQNLDEIIHSTRSYLTQGFIGGTSTGLSTTLGREGSDYTAAIVASCLDANSVTIWKDVPGVLSADPRYFEHTFLLSSISYSEAIELAFYGASVIHPKTLQPIQQKKIPLYVKPFLDPTAPGTCITGLSGIKPQYPCFILKRGELLIRLSTLDFSFMIEEHLGEIFILMARYRIKVDLLQNSAISISLCVQDRFGTLKELLTELNERFKVDLISNVDLYTIRHFNAAAIASIELNNEVLVKQVAGNMAQLVVK
ncbi:MAG: aspartate kinase [Leeuwenhoekiella sp.]